VYNQIYELAVYHRIPYNNTTAYNYYYLNKHIGRKESTSAKRLLHKTIIIMIVIKIVIIIISYDII
jgi:hypothetical protein